MRSFNLKTGLLSATTGAFIIEFYKTLSSDSGGQTVALLGQISQQLTNSRNGTSITAANQPFSPSAHMIWANAMWLISLVFSLTSALITSLNQQAVRRYIEMPKVPSKPNDRARVRLLLYRGIKLYKMPLAILAAPTLLHLSIWLFFGGLVIVFHTIYEKVAIAVDVAVGVSGLVYMAMSLLPLLDFKCPYRTPITYLFWYSWHASLSFAACCCLLLFSVRSDVPGTRWHAYVHVHAHAWFRLIRTVLTVRTVLGQGNDTYSPVCQIYLENPSRNMGGISRMAFGRVSSMTP
jgi:hypothetical protein